MGLIGTGRPYLSRCVRDGVDLRFDPSVNKELAPAWHVLPTMQKIWQREIACWRKLPARLPTVLVPIPSHV